MNDLPQFIARLRKLATAVIDLLNDECVNGNQTELVYLAASNATIMIDLLNEMESRAPAPVVIDDAIDTLIKHLWDNGEPRDVAADGCNWCCADAGQECDNSCGHPPISDAVRVLMGWRKWKPKSDVDQGEAKPNGDLTKAADELERMAKYIYVAPTADCINALRRCLAAHEKAQNK